MSVSISRQKSRGITGIENGSLEISEVDSIIPHGTNDESENIEDVVKSFVPSAFVKSKAAGEIIFSLSMEVIYNCSRKCSPFNLQFSTPTSAPLS